MKLFNHHHASARQQQDPWSRRIWNDPYLDWSIMLTCASALILVLTFFGYSVYSETVGALEAPLDPVSASDKAAFDESALSQVLTGFESRAAERTDIIKGAGVPGDPSI